MTVSRAELDSYRDGRKQSKEPGRGEKREEEGGEEKGDS